MGVIIPFVLPALLFIVLQWLWNRPAWLRVPDAVRGVSPSTALTPSTPEADPFADPFALPFVRRRIGVMAAELELLDDDDCIFAKAFRLHVARYAYEALLADASRLTAAAEAMDLEIVVSYEPLREELDV